MEATVYRKLLKKETSLALVGLGYVGMPIAVAFANKGLCPITDLKASNMTWWRL